MALALDLHDEKGFPAYVLITKKSQMALCRSLLWRNVIIGYHFRIVDMQFDDFFFFLIFATKDDA